MSVILILPGYGNSGAGHWQTYWEQELPKANRVQQRDWDRPDRHEWVAALDAAIRASDEPVILVAHSLGCPLVAWWNKKHGKDVHAKKVKGALLVAPPDVESENFPKEIVGFSPMPTDTFPFRAVVIASTNDPWCELARAQTWAAAWGAQFREVGARGHINAASELGRWPEGLSCLAELTKDMNHLG